MRFFSGLAVFLFFAASASAQQTLDYAAARNRAKMSALPILIFVNVPARPVDGFVVTRVDTLAGYPAKCIVMGDSSLNWKATFDPRAVDHDFRKAVQPQQATPFASSSAGRDAKLYVSVEALDEVNAARAQRGLHPYIRDDALTVAAMGAAKFRAENGIRGHTRNDFAFVPNGADCRVAGCGALTPDWGFQACAMFERWTHAGAAFAWGSDGRRYMHLFVK